MRLDNVKLAVFDSNARENFFPLTLTRPAFDLCFGTSTLLRRIEARLGLRVEYLCVPEYLAKLVKENHPGTSVNENISQRCLVINSLVSNQPEIWRSIEGALASNENSVFVDGSNSPVFAVLEEFKPEMIAKNFPRSKVPGRTVLQETKSPSLIRFPWMLINENALEIERSYTTKELVGTDLPSGPEKFGEKIIVSPGTEIQRFVTLDSREGPIMIGENARIESFSYLTGPCFIGSNVIVKSARIGHGSTISNHSRVAGEVEQSIISEYSNKSHEGYVGHSFIGSWVNLGALTTTSDLKNTYGEIKASVRGKTIKTGSVKVGAFLGDMAKTGIGTTITCGTSIGVSSYVLGEITSNIPSFTLYSDSSRVSTVEIYIDSAIETQMRMMRRRGVTTTENYIAMIKNVFKLTKEDRRKHKVSNGRFRR